MWLRQQAGNFNYQKKPNMNASKVKELAAEYVKFKNVDEEEMDLKDHIQLYESLLLKIEKAGLSFYDVSSYVRLAKVS